ncbi:hypothetical protein [Tahibacter soli]|uniref:DUF1579 domain-containing protein n=1 Tax=Tahibacter soli TaxID=2983605 RepID=A0A9X3YK12_9GAMM|nr:hypothetical protein [Tahibacter soli]MDC8012406.1 hypothetical protein [Tahibacter soli]
MNHDTHDERRRTVLMTAAAGIAAGLAVVDSPLFAAAADDAPVATTIANPNGKPGDFAFLAGEWKIRHRQLKQDGSGEWIEYDGEATVWTILGGVGSVEELRIPARSFSGMGLRLLDVDKRIWTDFWVNARSGVLTPPGMTGVFEDGAGTFQAVEFEDGKPITVRGVWDRITPASCRWHQGVSRDGGKTWEDNWFMDWTRVAAKA